MCVCVCLAAQSCLTLCDTMDYSLPGPFVHGDSPGKNTGVGCHVLLQEIFPTQGSNPGLQQCRQILYQLSHKGNLNSNKNMLKISNNALLQGTLRVEHQKFIFFFM